MTLALPYRLMYKTNVNYYMLMKFMVIYYALLLFVNKSSYSQSYGFSSCSSVAQSCPTLCNPMDCSTPGFPVPHHLPELAQTHVHWVGDAIQPSCPLLTPSAPALYVSQHQGLFQWDRSSHQAAKVLELQLQHQSIQWIFRVDFFRINWFDPLAVQETPKSLLQYHGLKASILQCLAFFLVQLLHPYMTTGKSIALTIYTWFFQ